MKTHWLTNIHLFTAWLLSVVGVVALLALGHEVLLVVIANGLGWNRYIGRFAHLLYYSLAGIVFLLYFFLAFDYFKRMAHKGQLLSSGFHILGVEIVALTGMQIVLTVFGYFPANWLNLFLLVLSALVGAGMLWLARRAQGKLSHLSTGH